jgi:hypothetical protein
MNKEMQERRQLLRWLDRSLLQLDLDGLRFIACVTAIRGMNEKELDLLIAHLKGEKPLLDNPSKRGSLES